MRPTAPLLVLTIGQGIAGGLTVMVALLVSMGGLSATRLDVVVLMALVAAGIGGIASFFHMHHIQAAKYILRRLKTSWLSREAITTGLFGGALAVLAIWTLFLPTHHGWAYVAFSWMSVCVALVAMWVTAMLYATIPAMLSWHTPVTVLSFLGVGLLSGAAISGVIVPFGHQSLRTLGVALLIWAGLTGVIKAMHFSFFRRARGEVRAETGTGLPFAPYRLQDTGTTKPPYRTQTQVWPVIPVSRRQTMMRWVWLLLIVGPMGFLGLAMATHQDAWGIAAGGSALLGTMAERWLFFADATHSSRVFFLDQPAVPSRVPNHQPIPLPMATSTKSNRSFGK